MFNMYHMTQISILEMLNCLNRDRVGVQRIMNIIGRIPDSNSESVFPFVWTVINQSELSFCLKTAALGL